MPVINFSSVFSFAFAHPAGVLPGVGPGRQAPEAVDRTVNELAARFGVHPNRKRVQRLLEVLERREEHQSITFQALAFLP